MEKMRRERFEKYKPIVDKFLSRGLTGRDLIALIYERLPERDETIARNIRYVSDINIDEIFSSEEINFLCHNFAEIFALASVRRRSYDDSRATADTAGETRVCRFSD